ncbi:MAG: grasp-with-spasm system ATP-grasp peptide maturase [Bacteroidales bacterium]|nr:grasp-with-spasm system ATP-grasp peptide maturase [Bacteroidales bacterium]
MIETIRNDYTTYKVIEWLKYYNVDYYTITPHDIINISINVHCNSVFLSINHKTLCLDDITGYWFRRGLFSVKMDKKCPYYKPDKEFVISSYHYSSLEKNTILQYLHYLLSEKKSLNSFLFSNVNKLIVLYEAKKHGLNVPKHLLTDSKKELELFYKDCNGNIISKVCSPSGGFETKNYAIYAYTELIDKKFINNMNNSFFTSYFQANINKRFEIRTFLLNSKFYSMAIFSQESKKTSIDFRKYSKEMPNRYIPFILPDTIEKKLLSLCTFLNLNSGSIDLIYSTDHEYYFLEINPVGQFGMLSTPCNYHLEREVARFFKT